MTLPALIAGLVSSEHPLSELPAFVSFNQSRQWQALVSVPAPVGYASVKQILPPYRYLMPVDSHPTEPQCSYDPVEGLTLAPDTDPLEKIRQLESQISMSLDPNVDPFLQSIS